MNAVQKTCAAIREQLAVGKWQPGVRLPSLSALAAQYGISRSTMWQALKLLKEESLIHTNRGGAIIAGTRQLAVPPSPTLLWEQVKVTIGRDILGGSFPDRFLPPLSKLARRYGVALNTLKKSLKGLESEGLLTIEGRKFRQPDFGGGRHQSSVMLISYGYSGKGIKLGDPRMPSIVESFEGECSRFGSLPQLQPFNHYDPMSLLRLRERVVQTRNSAGFIVNLWNPWVESLYKRWTDLLYFLVGHGKPVVVFDQSGNLVFPADLLARRNFRVLRIAGERAGEAIGRVLINQGHRTLAFITPFFNLHWVKDRYNGLARFVTAYGASVKPIELHALSEISDPTDLTLAVLGLDAGKVASLYKKKVSTEEVQALLARFSNPKWKQLRSAMDSASGMEIIRAMARFLSSVPTRYRESADFDYLMDALQHIASTRSMEKYLQPFFEKIITQSNATAWVCSDDKTALTAIALLQNAGRQVPNDVAVFGFDNWREAAEEGLSTYDFNMRGMVQQALIMIHDDKSLRGQPTIAEVDGYAVERGSSRV